MAEISELLWDDQNIAHIAGHDVTVTEVEEVVFGEASMALDLNVPDRPGRIAVVGHTASGRALAVYLDTPTATGRSYVLTARPMTNKEQRLHFGEEETE